MRDAVRKWLARVGAVRQDASITNGLDVTVHGEPPPKAVVLGREYERTIQKRETLLVKPHIPRVADFVFRRYEHNIIPDAFTMTITNVNACDTSGLNVTHLDAVRGS